MVGSPQDDAIDTPIDDDLDLSGYVTVEDDEDVVEESAKAVVAKVLESNQGPLIDLKVAEKKIGADILDILDAKFKGQLTEARHPDAADRLF